MDCDLVTVDAVRSLLDYDIGSGDFTWKVKRRGRNGGVSPGDKAGKVAGPGYVYIGLLGKTFLAHRLAIFHVTGAWPAGDVDHIDGNPLNNRFANLRDVTHRTNLQNRRTAQRNNSAGLLGVSARKDGTYSSEIALPFGRLNLGRFATAEEAHAAYIDAKRRLHEGCTI